MLIFLFDIVVQYLAFKLVDGSFNFIIVGNGIFNASSNPGQGCLHFTLC